ncbi:LysR substrate-binding domain-containing protein, partial [Rhizobium ecuadorense]|uniref:LysR substrate-binding domain-containing protein n=1 Tax=Rhizobium ecuadorense TaxID=1671795 RepID=UPI000AB96135
LHRHLLSPCPVPADRARGRHCISPILARLLDEHPNLELDLSFNERIVDLLEDGFDLVIRNGPLKDNPDLMARAIARQRMTV